MVVRASVAPTRLALEAEVHRLTDALRDQADWWDRRLQQLRSSQAKGVIQLQSTLSQLAGALDVLAPDQVARVEAALELVDRMEREIAWPPDIY